MDGSVARGSEKEQGWEYPAINLAALINGESEDAFSELELCAALIVEVLDGATARFVRVPTVEALKPRLSQDEAKMVPAVIKALSVRAKVYVDIQEPAQWKMRHLIVHGTDPEARLVRLEGVYAPKVDLDRAWKTSMETRNKGVAALYGSQPLDMHGEPLGVAAAASLADLVLGRVVVLQILGLDASDWLVARMLLPAVCDRNVDGAEAVQRFQRCLVTHAAKRAGILAVGTPGGHSKGNVVETPLMASVVGAIRKRHNGASATGNLLDCFLDAIFDRKTCPNLPAFVNVSDVMVSRGLARVLEDENPAGALGGGRRLQHLAALEQNAVSLQQGLWSLPASRRGKSIPRGVSDCFVAQSDFPALLIADILRWGRLRHKNPVASRPAPPPIAAQRGRGNTAAVISVPDAVSSKRKKKGKKKKGPTPSKEDKLFYAALITKIVDGDTFRFIPVLSDESVGRVLDLRTRTNLTRVGKALRKDTPSIMNVAQLPCVQLASWPGGVDDGRLASMETSSILAQLYAVDAPEVRSQHVFACEQQQPNQASPAARSWRVYGSEKLDKGGQPLGVAATRALAELILGRVVLVQDLGRDVYERMVARVLVPAVSDRKLDGEAAYEQYFACARKVLKQRASAGRRCAAASSVSGAAQGFTASARSLWETPGNHPNSISECLIQSCMQTQVGGIAGLVDASEQLLRRGLATVYRPHNVHVEYLGRLQELLDLEKTAQKSRLGVWSLPSGLFERPIDYRARTRKFGHPSAKIRKRRGCRIETLLGMNPAGGSGTFA